MSCMTYDPATYRLVAVARLKTPFHTKARLNPPVFTNEAKLLAGMALLRLIAGSIEISGSLLMLKFQRIETAIQINALLGLIGPSIFIMVSALGIIGLAGKLSYAKLILIGTGVLLILIAARK